MADSATQLAEQDWSQLANALEAFLAAWEEESTPPVIADFLAASPAALRRELALELVKADLEQRWTRGLRRLIEDYLADVPELDGRVPADVILEEYHVRKQASDDVQPREFFDRFPDQVLELERLFGLDPSTASVDSSGTAGSSAIGLSPGDSIDDFDLLLRLGQGAFATVFLARQRSMQRLVAVKISADRGNEPQTLAQLDHDNIVRVYDQRRVPDRGLRLLYMQYAAGGTLAGVLVALRRLPKNQWNGCTFLKTIDAELESRGESPPAESSLRLKLAEMSWPQTVCWIGAQLARALDAAHRHGVLHRDLKPANVLLTAEGVPKLADFNISFSAKLEGSSPAAYFGGSLAYMSPEQLEACNPRHAREAASLDGRSDLFSLAVVLWELLTGERPFQDAAEHLGWGSRLEEMTQRRQQVPSESSLPEFADADAPGLATILCRCLAARPDDRFSTGLELANELELCLQPEAQRLLRGSAEGWKRWGREWPILAIVFATVAPNLVAGVFNFLYNRGEILQRIPTAEPVFMRIQSIINLIVYPIGMILGWWFTRSVAQAIRIDVESTRTSQSLAVQRRRCLDLGNVAANVGLGLWLVAAPAYPIALHLMLGDVPAAVYVHFVVSLALCGLIAAAYPFFGVTLLALRCWYPALVRWESITRDDLVPLQRLQRQTWLYLVLAAAVPMVAVAILVLSGQDRRFALGVLAASGAVGFVIAVSTFRLVQSDLAVLLRAMSRDQRRSA